MDEKTYRVGGLIGSRRELYRVETGETIARVESDAGPCLIGDMTEEQARDRFPEAFERKCWRKNRRQ